MVTDPADPDFGHFFPSDPMFSKDTDETFQALKVLMNAR